MTSQPEHTLQSTGLDRTRPAAFVERKWVKGQSGNPGGVGGPVREAQRLAKEATPAAMRRLIELVGSADERVALVAAQGVLDRSMGKPKGPLPDEAPKAPMLDFSQMTVAELDIADRMLQAMAELQALTAARLAAEAKRGKPEVIPPEEADVGDGDWR